MGKIERQSSSEASVLLGMLLALLLMPFEPARAAEMANDPKGFHSLAWGASLENLPGFKRVGQTERIREYELHDGPAPLGEARVDSMRFVTIDGKFARVVIRYRGKKTHEQVLSYLESQFGPSDYRPGEMMRGLNQEHAWRGPETEIHVTYEDMGQRGSVFIESRVLAPRFLEDIGGA